MPYCTVKHTQKEILKVVFLFLFFRCINQGSESQGGLSQGERGWNQASLAVDKTLSPSAGHPHEAQHASFRGVEKETLGPFTGFPCA